MNRHARPIPTLLALCLLVLAAACGSETSQTIRTVRVEISEGNYRTAYQKINEALADPARFTPAQRAELERHRDAARAVLSQHYASHLTQRLISDDMVGALGAFETVREEFPEIASNVLLMQRVMRVQVQMNELANARETARMVLAATDNEETRAGIAEFLATLDQVEQSAAQVETLRDRVMALSDKARREFDQIRNSGRSCVTMKQIEEELAPEEVEEINRYFAALETYNTLRRDLYDPSAVR
jgi:cell division protein FtsB